ncbi:MAG: YggS family pyridoxal phosphate-dependent enzyme [FCB group bacterium]|nr:YggS family pyridoxal phosphate-dependent enzyme [FCB group bacterium]
MKQQIAENYIKLKSLVAHACEMYHRNVDDITIVAVTKTHPADYIKAAVDIGIHDVGENKVQEAETKILALGNIARYHMIGHLQTNKVKKAVKLFDVIQAVDSFKLAQEINRRAAEINKEMECYIEVNASGESQKYGVLPKDYPDLVEKVNRLDHINLTGLMTVGPFVDDEEQIRAVFRRCYHLFTQSREIIGGKFKNLSMGMTHDFILAIAEGSTMIRIGTALFGVRNYS